MRTLNFHKSQLKEQKLFMASLTRVFGTTVVALTVAIAAISLSGGLDSPQVSGECQNNIPLIGSPFAQICNHLR